MRQIRTLKGSFTKKQLESLLGEPTWEWDMNEDKEPKCGLAPGVLPTAVGVLRQPVVGYGYTRMVSVLVLVWIFKRILNMLKRSIKL